MAFNPFRTFRKHQKAMFAGLTILCMFIFVGVAGIGSFAGGDFFSWLAGLLGGSSRIPEVATLYGKRIDEREIAFLRQQRQIASDFMRYATQMAISNIEQDAIGPQSSLDEETKNRLQNVFRSIAQGFSSGADFYFVELDRMQRELMSANRPTDAEKIRLFSLALRQQLRLSRNIYSDELYPGSTLYFGGALTPEGLLDFMIWLREADRLGIQLSDDDVKSIFRQETFSRLSPADTSAIARLLPIDRRNPKEVLYNALRDEFRVRLAQAALVGFDATGSSQVPAPITPYELWEYYRPNRTEVNVKLLPISVRSFLTQVKEQPSDAELQELYEKYKDQEYAPERETPGFKQPRRVQIEWIEASPNSEGYRKAASLAAAAIQLTTPGSWAVKLLHDYESDRVFNYGSSALTGPDFFPSFVTFASNSRPETAASLLGLLGAGGTRAPLLTAIVGNQGVAVVQESKDLAAAVEREKHDRAHATIPLVGALFSIEPSHGLAFAIPGLWESGEEVKRYLPFEVVKKDLKGKVEQAMSQELVKSSVEAFKKELTNKRGLPREEIEKYVQAQVQSHGWKHGIMAAPKESFELAKDPALATLKEQYLKGYYGRDDPRARRFGPFILSDAKASDPSKLYAARDWPLADLAEPLVHWRTVDEPAKVIPFDEAKAGVVSAWKLEKARALAKAEAEKVIEEARKSGGDPIPNLTEASQRYGTKLIELDGVAHLKPAMSARAGVGREFEVYRVSEEKIEYPSRDFVTEVLKLQEKGEVALLTDLPKENYYIVALTQRSEPTVKDFQRDTSPSFFQYQNSLLGQLEQERRQDYRLAILHNLRARAHLSINPEGRKSLEDRRGSSDE